MAVAHNNRDAVAVRLRRLVSIVTAVIAVIALMAILGWRWLMYSESGARWAFAVAQDSST